MSDGPGVPIRHYVVPPDTEKRQGKIKKYMSDFVRVCCLKLIENSRLQIELAEMNSK